MLNVITGRNVIDGHDNYIVVSGRTPFLLIDISRAYPAGGYLNLFTYALSRAIGEYHSAIYQFTATKRTSDIAICLNITTVKAGPINTLPIGSLFIHRGSSYLKINDQLVVNMNSRQVVDYRAEGMFNYSSLFDADLEIDYSTLPAFSPLTINRSDDLVDHYDAAIQGVLIANGIRSLAFYKFGSRSKIHLYGKNFEGQMMEVTVDRFFNVLGVCTVYSGADSIYSR